MSGFDPSLLQKKWPAREPEKLQLYSTATPNGVKVSIALEEMGVDYEAHFVDIMQNETFGPEFLSLNPNGKIPAIVDPDGPGGQAFGLWESGAILHYLAQKTGKLLPAEPASAAKALQWVFFQMAGVGPVLGQLGYFHCFAGKDIEDKRPLQRFVNESKRVLDVLEGQLAQGPWLLGQTYSIADISFVGWIRVLDGFYQAGELLELSDRPALLAWRERMLARDAVQRGLKIPERPAL